MLRNLYKKRLIYSTVIVIVFVFLFIFFGSYLRNIFYQMSHSVGFFVTEKITYSYKYIISVFDKSDLIKTNDELVKKNYELISKLAEYDSLLKENESLKKQLGVPEKNDRKLTIAKIFSIDRSITQTMMIDKGEKDDLKKGMPVIYGGNVLIGVIDEVFESSSRVILIEDTRFSLSVKIGKNDVLASIKGVGIGGLAKIELVTNEDEIAVGDLIVSSGLDNVPQSLIIGEIIKSELKGGNLFKDVESKIFYDFKMGPNVFVIKQ